MIIKCKLNDKAICYMSCILCFVTNLSQIPFFVESGITRYVSLPVWILFFCFFLFKNKKINIRKFISFYFLIGIFMCYFAFMSIINPDFLQSDLVYPIVLSAFVTFVGLLISKKIRIDCIYQIFTSYILSGIIVCFSVFFKYIYGKSLVGSVYLYGSKNSVALILLTTWILILIYKINIKNKFIKGFYICNFILLTYTILALKSRTVLICIPLILFILLINKNVGKNTKKIIIFSLVILLILMLNDKFFDFFTTQFIFAGRNTNNLDSLSSGRYAEWLAFPIEFMEAGLFGLGKAKRESIFLTSFLEYGLIGGTILILIILMPIIGSWRNVKKNGSNIINLTFFLLCIVYTINGIFEQLAPFGPGVKCYFLWLLYGMLIGKSGERTVAEHAKY